MYSNNMLNFQDSTTILNACKKKFGNLLKAPRTKCFKKNKGLFNETEMIIRFGLVGSGFMTYQPLKVI